jgi:hypothetical protein
MDIIAWELHGVNILHSSCVTLICCKGAAVHAYVAHCDLHRMNNCTAVLSYLESAHELQCMVLLHRRYIISHMHRRCIT